jgi:membrane protein
MKVWQNIKGFFKMLWQTIQDFLDDKVLRMAAALAYYTIFSIGPILILLISLLDTFYGKDAIEGKIYGQISNFVGSAAATQIQEIIARSAVSGKGSLAAIVSAVILVFSATSVFGEVQDSINTIWRLKAKPKKGWLKMIINRLLSFSMVISLGFLLMVSLVLNALVEALGSQLSHIFPQLSLYVLYIINLALVFIITSLLFGIIFKVLPDAKIQWKHVAVGAMATAGLFMLGKWGISFYLGRSKVSTTYGAAGSIIVVLLWVYYSAIILYFGAEFTRNFAQWRGSRIYPNEYAVWVEHVEVESKSILHETHPTVIETAPTPAKVPPDQDAT